MGHTIVTEPSCWDGKYRYHVIYEAAYRKGMYLVRVHESTLKGHNPDTWYGGKVLNLACPAHTLEEAERLAKVFWMDHLGWDYHRTELAQTQHALASV